MPLQAVIVINILKSGFVGSHLVQGRLCEAVDSVRLDTSLKVTVVKGVNNHPPTGKCPEMLAHLKGFCFETFLNYWIGWT